MVSVGFGGERSLELTAGADDAAVEDGVAKRAAEAEWNSGASEGSLEKVAMAWLRSESEGNSANWSDLVVVLKCKCAATELLGLVRNLLQRNSAGRIHGRSQTGHCTTLYAG
jgi:hypothetical protein